MDPFSLPFICHVLQQSERSCLIGFNLMRPISYPYSYIHANACDGTTTERAINFLLLLRVEMQVPYCLGKKLRIVAVVGWIFVFPIAGSIGLVFVSGSLHYL